MWIKVTRNATNRPVHLNAHWILLVESDSNLTKITFKDAGAFLVKEKVQDVVAALEAATARTGASA